MGKGLACSMLLAWSLLTGQCVLCQHTQSSQPSPHDCCKPVQQDDCHKSGDHKQCPGHDSAFESSGKIETPTPASVVPPAAGSVALTLLEPLLLTASTPRVEHAQPPPLDRLLLTTVLLI